MILMFVIELTIDGVLVETNDGIDVNAAKGEVGGITIGVKTRRDSGECLEEVGGEDGAKWCG